MSYSIVDSHDLHACGGSEEFSIWNTITQQLQLLPFSKTLI